MSTLSIITVALLLTFIGAAVGQRLKYPRVIGQLVISFLLAIPLFQTFFTEESLTVIEIMSEVGVIFLLLLTGLELDLEKFKKNKKIALIIAISGAIVPFVSGLMLGLYLELGWVSAIVIGTCLSVTAEGTTVAVLVELKKIKTRIANIIIGAGIIDDIFEVIFLTLIIFLAHKNTSPELNLIIPLEKFLLFAWAVLLLTKFLPKVINLIKPNSNGGEISLVSAIIIIGLGMATLSEFVGIGSLLGAFIAGIILQKSFFNKKTLSVESHYLSIFTFAFIIPFFFVNIGINFDYHGLIENPIITILITAVAIASKILGTLITKPLTNLSWQQLHIIGWGMNSRGVMELVIAHIALNAGLINSTIYSAIVFMAIFTTLTFPIAFKYIVSKNPHILE